MRGRVPPLPVQLSVGSVEARRSPGVSQQGRISGRGRGMWSDWAPLAMIVAGAVLYLFVVGGG